MRKFKFRAISMCQGEQWLYGDLRHYNHNPHTEKWTIHDPLTNVETDIEPNTVGQFTGLLDKNGREIYEGDIIVQHANDMPDIRGMVVYDMANARFGMSYTTYWESGSVTIFDTLERVKCYADCNRELAYEVIGNVHDNPDLMLEKDLNVFECEM